MAEPSDNDVRQSGKGLILCNPYSDPMERDAWQLVLDDFLEGIEEEAHQS